MGANFNSRVITTDISKEAIIKQWNGWVDDSLYESGHSYSGEIGMLGYGIDFREEAFATENQADEFLSDTHEKWDKAMAVRFHDREAREFWLIGGWCSS